MENIQRNAEVPRKLLEVNGLKTSFFTASGELKAVDDISYYVHEQEIIALVGESGCGKSVSQLSVIQLIQNPPGRIISGEVVFNGKNLLEYGASSNEMRAVRGAEITMIFQEPMTSLNPVLTVGNQLSEVIMTHKKIHKKEAWALGTEALSAVGISDAAERMRSYPFQMSGGMRQRVMIATAIACGSKMIIADEPTTALDVTTQAQVMELLLRLVDTYQTSLVLVTHNLGLVTRYAKRIYVMYAGRIIESGTTEDLLTRPRHPYTIGLLESVPRLDMDKGRDLVPLHGVPPNLLTLPSPPRCAFLPRCAYAQNDCEKKPFPGLRQVEGTLHFIACYRDVAEWEG